MRETICRLDGPVEFLSIGQFVSGPGWRHMRRTIDSYELIFVHRGILPFRVGERRMAIGAGEIALVPPGIEHAGTAIITEDLEFHWMHMRLPQTRTIRADEPDYVPLPQDSHLLILPDFRRAVDPDRLSVMCNQLMDIYARLGPHANAYCDYFATAILLEVSAQERAAHTDGMETTSSRRFSPIDPSNGATAGPIDTKTGLGPMLSVRAWIRANAFDDITVAGVAKRFHYSPSYLTALYKRVFGVGVAGQIIEYRIEHARDLLSSTSMPVAEIGRAVGYDDPKYFMRVFKRRTGLTPRQYRVAFPTRLYNAE